MLKKLLVIFFIVTSNYVFANTTQADSDTNAVANPSNMAKTPIQPVKTPTTPVINPANAGSGSKYGSNQIFGNAPITGQKGEKYYTKEQLNNGQNSAGTGSKVGSNQVFGNTPVTGEKGQKYYTKEELANPKNTPVAPNSSKYGIDGPSQ